ncbi:hypothetical protein [Mycolicibacterium stellerae]|uniref:hypothetical protein n=1 Tax=Mycolicibacterium stellerae TaxID=2358193 RepID=UPI0013DE3048|nr:hypothetical protein [Mycolicibacterium stellerae]
MTPLHRTTMVLAMMSVLVAVGCRAESQADTPTFPDVSGWTAVDVRDYEVDTTTPGRPSTGTYFITPDGIICGFATFPPAVGCAAENLPGVPPLTDPKPGIVQSIGTDRPPKATNASIGQDGKVHGNPVKTLPPFHTITVDGMTCGVDDGGTTACKDQQDRGFVLSPRGSGWLPKV